MTSAGVAFIGGTGLYEVDSLDQAEAVCMDTPFGAPSDMIVVGRLNGLQVAFLPRHGRGHIHTPSHLPSRANIYALKTLGVERIISVNAVGSLDAKIQPRDIVTPNQIIDRTRGRISTFFDSGPVAYIGFADPFCPELSSLLANAVNEAKITVHREGTLVVIEGPAFSTRAESKIYQTWGGTIVGMTALPEAKLAREAEMCYASLSLVTDRDSWDDDDAVVSQNVISEHLEANAKAAKEVLVQLMATLSIKPTCVCNEALRDAIITAPHLISAEDKVRLGPIIQKYL